MPLLSVHSSLSRNGTSGSKVSSDLRYEVSIKAVRDAVEAKISANSDLYDTRDIKDLREKEWTVIRFLLDKDGDEEEAADALNRCLLWRKSSGINDLSASHFPKEFFEAGILTMGRDKDDTRVLFMRSKLYQKVPEWTGLFKSFMDYIINQMDSEANEKRFALIIDTTDVGINQLDLDLTTHVVNHALKYYVNCAKYVWIYEPPWITRPILSVLLKLIPQKHSSIVNIVDKKAALEILGLELLPTFMGGKKEVTLNVPEEALCLEMIAESLGSSTESTKKMRKHFNGLKELKQG